MKLPRFNPEISEQIIKKWRYHVSKKQNLTAHEKIYYCIRYTYPVSIL